jgi:hypothetical protein
VSINFVDVSCCEQDTTSSAIVIKNHENYSPRTSISEMNYKLKVAANKSWFTGKQNLTGSWGT